MRTVLVALNAKFVHSNLAIRYIKEYSGRNEIELFETTINDSFLETAMQLAEKKPELVGFSCYLWNVEMALKISGILKELLPQIKILFGGPEVSYNGTEYLHNHWQLDYIIQGEGEQPFRQLLDALEQGSKEMTHIKGLVYRSNNKIIQNQWNEGLMELSDIPFPYRSELPGKILYYEAARGCPFRCTYCLSGSLGAIRYFNIDRVKADLKQLIDNGVELVKFVDRTFNANRRFADEIWSFLIQHAAGTRFHFEIAADLLDEQNLQVLATAPKDLFQFEIGVQTTNSQVLDAINRKMDFIRLSDNLRTINRFGTIPCHLDLIAGLPGEDMASFIRSFEDCMALGPNVLQLGFLKVLKGTTIHESKEQYGIRYMNTPNYHVLCTDHMSFDDIRRLMRFEKVFENYWNSGIFRLTMSLVLDACESCFGFFEGFGAYLAEHGFFLRNMDLKDKFQLLLDYLAAEQQLLYNMEELHDLRQGAALKTIRDMMVHDYILNTKKASLPEFLRREISSGDKDKINGNKQQISAYFHGTDLKKLFYVPVASKLVSHGAAETILFEQGILICNPVTSEYCYI